MEKQNEAISLLSRPSGKADHVPRLLSPQQELKTLLPKFEKLLTQLIGKPIRPSTEKAFNDFALLPEAHQHQALNVLKFQEDVIRTAISGGLNAYSERTMLRVAMEKLELLVDENLLDKVHDSDVVEIFDSNQIQVYRSFSCFALCNYSLAELAAYPWFMLYERPAWVQHRLIELGLPIYRDGPGFQNLESLQPYAIREALTEEKAAFLLREKFLGRMISMLTHEKYLLSVKCVTPLEASSEANLVFFGERRSVPAPTLPS